MRLSGLNCIVTGGSSGIGAASVKRFVDEGAKVLIAAVSYTHLTLPTILLV